MSSRIARLIYIAALVLVTGLAARHAYEYTLHRVTDWIVFEVGARVLVHYHHQPLYGDPRLHLYVDNADIQVGPPALWLVAAFESLSFRTINLIFSIIMPALGVIGILAIARCGTPWPTDFRALTSKVKFAGIGLLVGGIWGFESDQWKHLDDAMALSLTAIAVYLIIRQRPWWIVGLVLGTAVATKPWAIILTPILLGLNQRDRPKATLSTIAVAAAWWAPFLIAAPGTVQALGHFSIQSHAGSVLYLLGIRGGVERWLRPVQFIVGIAVGILAARRRGITAAPVAALATRVLTDPYAYPYYGLGPLLFAYLFDRGRGDTRWLIGLTELTALLDFGFARIWGSPTWVASGKVAFAVITLAWVFLSGRDRAYPAVHEQHGAASAADDFPQPLPGG